MHAVTIFLIFTLFLESVLRRLYRVEVKHLTTLVHRLHFETFIKRKRPCTIVNVKHTHNYLQTSQ